jgi:hypothetical protein
MRFGFAAFPTISPIADQKFKAEGVDLHTGLETNTQVSEIHFVLLRVGEEK